MALMSSWLRSAPSALNAESRGCAFTRKKLPPSARTTALLLRKLNHGYEGTRVLLHTSPSLSVLHDFLMLDAASHPDCAGTRPRNFGTSCAFCGKAPEHASPSHCRGTCGAGQSRFRVRHESQTRTLGLFLQIMLTLNMLVLKVYQLSSQNKACVSCRNTTYIRRHECQGWKRKLTLLNATFCCIFLWHARRIVRTPASHLSSCVGSTEGV